MDTEKVHQAAWINAPDPFWGSAPVLSISSMFTFVLAYLAITVNTMGSVIGLAPIVGADHVDRRLNRGLAVTGLSGILSAVLGVIGTVPYSNSPGVVAVTKAGTRFALTAAGVILILLALFSKVTALLTLIPDAVVAAAMLIALAAQVGVGLNIINRGQTALSSRDFLVVGLPILLGMAAGILPSSFLNLLPAILKPILNNGLIVGLVSVLLLEHLLLKEKT